jgi:hypothetical protein
MADVLCPSCRRPLLPSGEVEIAGQCLAVYQCDDCVVDWEFDGEIFPAALTFALTEDGNMLNPDTGEPLPPPAGASSN